MEKEKKHFKNHFYIEIIMGILIIISLIFEIRDIKVELISLIESMKIYRFFDMVINNDIAMDLLIVVLPLVITIISIGLQLPNEKIFGLKRFEFNKLRSSWYYSFLDIVLVACVLFLIYSICLVFSLKICMLMIDVVAIAYAVIFSCQEIPILTYNEKRIFKILKHAHDNIMQETYRKSDFDKLYTQSIEHIIFKKDIKSAFHAISGINEKDINIIKNEESVQDADTKVVESDLEDVNEGRNNEEKN